MPGADPERLIQLTDIIKPNSYWIEWCARQELNLRPAGSKPDALSN
jgi:hypothetical protein